MWIIIDKKAPQEAKEVLQRTGLLIELETQGIVYEAISGHPDIFFFQYPAGLFMAPNTPEKYYKLLTNLQIPFTPGQKRLSIQYPDTASFNALYTSYGLLHNQFISDPAIQSTHKNLLHCKQAYTRCNAIEVGGTIFTSDKGIEKALNQKNIPVFFVDPSAILLQGFQHGFFGGCCGIHQNKLFICGSLNHINQGSELKVILDSTGVDVIELYQGPLMDIGGIFFIPDKFV